MVKDCFAMTVVIYLHFSFAIEQFLVFEFSKCKFKCVVVGLCLHLIYLKCPFVLIFVLFISELWCELSRLL